MNDSQNDSNDWQGLCRQAAVEQDPDRLLQLTRRINEILLEKEERLRRRDQAPRGSADPTHDREQDD